MQTAVVTGRRNRHELGQDSYSSATPTTPRVYLPREGYLGRLMFHLDITVSTTSGAVTIVSSTLGAIPLIDNISFKVGGKHPLLDVSGRQLDYWMHINRAGMERFALSSTTSADPWDARLSYDLWQSPTNLLGVLLLNAQSTAMLEFRMAAISAIASGTGVSLTGVVRVSGERLDFNPQAPLPAEFTNYVHRLTAFRKSITNTGPTDVSLEGYKGEFLERALLVPNNNSAVTDSMFDRVDLKNSKSDVAESWLAEDFRAEQREKYGSDDIPETGVLVLDRREAAQRDVIPLGDASAPDPHLTFNVPSSGVTLTSAYVDVIAETLMPVAA
ncbi:MAG: hypothetical protein EPO65_06780 [Dehalococcoidia bacterium]|nr:MAG: hypothetical protein EPO65_06780 [Dehalococcoidia bacterium]